MEEEKIYQPHELYFSIYKDPEEDSSDYWAVGWTVCFTTIEWFNEEHCQSDDLGGHNVNNEALIKAGLCDTELLESVFEVEIGDTKEEIHQNLFLMSNLIIL